MSEFPTPYNDWNLDGQVALVTGTTSGLGVRFATVLAKAGAKVALTGRRVERLADLEKQIQQDGGECASFRLDMTDMDNVTGVVGQVEETLGTPTILVNNAGIPDAQYAHKMDQGLIDTVFDTNLRGPYVLSCEVARRLIAKKLPGRMVNISSVGGFNYAGGGAALYSITKAGIARMSEVLAVEWARFNINVNCIAPGAFDSEMMDGMVSRIGEFYKQTPRGRLCNPAQLDSTLLYLCAPASECVTGTIIKVDDGQGGR
ncbi:MAG: SDR family NAD(P)-dependent oxidoreductase [Myxococcota bacterium]|jgi:NAD(P)-dependent dehydrogenase (short-subunit alcohol dehydrogenase family)|nr:SDR family NAD(P)-dependent oxidoreductase [Myxococcota bacterium]